MKEIHLVTKNVQASFWKRVLAYIIDLLVVEMIIVWPFRGFFEKAELSYLNLFTEAIAQKLIWVSFFIMLLSLAYWVLFEWKLRQTIGKMMLNLYVSSKGELRFSQALTRNITKPFPLALLIDVAYMFFKRQNQRLFEKFSDTNVIETRWMVK